MKTFTRVVAVLMLVAVLSTLMAACGKPKNYIDDNLIGTWKQTDDKNGNWTWTFNKDGTCKLEGGPDNFSSEGTFFIGDPNLGKIKINLKEWKEEKMFTYTVTPKALDLESFDDIYYCKKQ